MTVTCPHCGSADHVSMLVQATIRAPGALVHQLSKRNLRRKDCYLMGVNWETADFLCDKCGVLIKDGYGNYVTELEKRVSELEAELAAASSSYHSHKCRECKHEYTPQPGESEDCPICGHNGK